MNRRTLYVLFFSIFVMFLVTFFVLLRTKTTSTIPVNNSTTPDVVATTTPVPSSEKKLLLDKYPLGQDTTLYRFVSFDGNKTISVVANGVSNSYKLAENFPLFCNKATFKNSQGVDTDASTFLLDYSKMPDDAKYTFIKSALDIPLDVKISALSSYAADSPIRLDLSNGVVTKITIYVKDPKNCK